MIRTSSCLHAVLVKPQPWDGQRPERVICDRPFLLGTFCRGSDYSTVATAIPRPPKNSRPSEFIAVATLPTNLEVLQKRTRRGCRTMI